MPIPAHMAARMIMTTTIMTMITTIIMALATMTTVTITIMDTTTTILTATPIAAMGRSRRPPSECPPMSAARPAAVVQNDQAALYRLMTWLSPSFPVGSFSYSSGIEWAVEAGDITDAETLRGWLSAMLSDGQGVCDGILLAHAWRAGTAQDDKALAEVAELGAAFAPSRERQLETTAQGRAFVEIAGAAWSCAALQRLIEIWPGPFAYPVAVGTVAAGHQLPLDLTLHAFLHAQAANWISAGVRLIPLGQTDSQRVLAALEGVVTAVAARALEAPLDELGSATFRADLASMHHETQYTRLFRT